MPKLLIYVLCILLSCTTLYGQVTQTKRFEKEYKSVDDPFTLISLKQEGIALLKGTNKYKAGNRTWEVTLLDTALHQTDSLVFEVDTRNNLIGYDYSPGYVHILFLKNATQGEMLLVTVQIITKAVSKYEINPELAFSLTHFHRVGPNFIFGGVVTQEPCVLLFNPKTENLKILPGFFKKETELLDMRVNENETFNTVLIDRTNLDNRNIIFRTFDSSGKELIEDIIPVESKISLQTGISSKLQREDLVVMGVWSKNKSRAATGFYCLPINPNNKQDLKLIYFGQLEHYLDYLKPKKAASVKSKTQDALASGKMPDFTNYIIPYKILEHPQGFILLAESHSTTSPNQYSNYGTSAYYTPYPNYSPYRSNYPPPQSYYSPQPYGNNIVTNEDLRKIESVAVNINANGDVLWDFSLKFEDLKTQSLNQTSDISIQGDSLYILYKTESRLVVKSINLTSKESNTYNQPLKLNTFFDKVTWEDEQNTELECWFDNIFYVAGYQSISNKSRVERKRDVFFINKISIR